MEFYFIPLSRFANIIIVRIRLWCLHAHIGRFHFVKTIIFYMADRNNDGMRFMRKKFIVRYMLCILPAIVWLFITIHIYTRCSVWRALSLCCSRHFLEFLFTILIYYHSTPLPPAHRYYPTGCVLYVAGVPSFSFVYNCPVCLCA